MSGHPHQNSLVICVKPNETNTSCVSNAVGCRFASSYGTNTLETNTLRQRRNAGTAPGTLYTHTCIHAFTDTNICEITALFSTAYWRLTARQPPNAHSYRDWRLHLEHVRWGSVARRLAQRDVHPCCQHPRLQLQHRHAPVTGPAPHNQWPAGFRSERIPPRNKDGGTRQPGSISPV